MSGKEQAQYIVNLPLEEYRALQKVIDKIKPTNLEVLKVLIQSHKCHHEK